MNVKALLLNGLMPAFRTMTNAMVDLYSYVLLVVIVVLKGHYKT